MLLDRPPHQGASSRQHPRTLHTSWKVVNNADRESVDQAYLDNRVADLLIRQRHDPTMEQGMVVTPGLDPL